MVNGLLAFLAVLNLTLFGFDLFGNHITEATYFTGFAGLACVACILFSLHKDLK